MKKGEMNLMMIVIVTLILGLLVLVFYYVLMFQKAYLPKWFVDILPTYIIGNMTRNSTYNCPNIVAEIGKGNYLYFNGVGSHVYFKDANQGVIKGLLYLDDGSALSKDPQIGYLAWNKERNRDEIVIDSDYLEVYNKKYESYKDKISLEDLKYLRESYKYRDMNVFCKSDSEAEIFIFGKDCRKAGCSIFEGTCSGTPIQGKIADGRLDCKEDEKCYVEPKYTKIVDNGLNISLFDSALWNNPKEKIDFLTLDETKIVSGEFRSIGFNFKSSVPYCYILGSDSEVYAFGYVERNGKITVPSLAWTPKNEKMIELVAWNKDTKQKVLKRVKIIEDRLPEGYREGKIIDDAEFKKEVLKTADNDALYVLGLKHDWYNDNIVRATNLYYANYLIVVASQSDVRIYADDISLSKPGNPSWHKLNCNTMQSTWKTFGGGLFTKRELTYTTVLEDSLSMTLNKCSWGKG